MRIDGYECWKKEDECARVAAVLVVAGNTDRGMGPVGALWPSPHSSQLDSRSELRCTEQAPLPASDAGDYQCTLTGVASWPTHCVILFVWPRLIAAAYAS